MSKFRPGESGNPGGRPKGFAELRDFARHHTVAAIEKLVSIMATGQSEQAQLLAANSLLDRGWGKPTQAIAGDPEGTPLIHEHRTAILAEISRIVTAGGGGGEAGDAE